MPSVLIAGRPAPPANPAGGRKIRRPCTYCRLGANTRSVAGRKRQEELFGTICYLEPEGGNEVSRPCRRDSRAALVAGG